MISEHPRKNFWTSAHPSEACPEVDLPLMMWCSRTLPVVQGSSDRQLTPSVPPTPACRLPTSGRNSKP